MGDSALAVLVVVGIVLFVIGLKVLKAVMSRGLDKVLDFGMKTVNKARNDEIAQFVAVPLVLKSPVSIWSNDLRTASRNERQEVDCGREGCAGA